MRNSIGRFLLSPTLYTDAPGDGGGGGMDMGGGGSPAAGATDGAPAEPSVIEVPGDDALVKFPGSDKPLKAKDIRNFQSQWTREAQKRAQLEKQLQERDAQLQRFEQERRLAAQRQTQGQGQQPSIYDKLRELPYLDGGTAAEVIQTIGRDIQMRDQIMLRMAQELQRMQQTLGGLNETHTNSAFDAKIDRWLTEGGYPTDLRDVAKEIYLAYEGDDLDVEFPRIFAERVDMMRRAFEAERQAKLTKARQNVFVPGKGSAQGPSKPLQFKGNESSKEVADAIFATFMENGT